jgi:hypothetical protein
VVSKNIIPQKLAHKKFTDLFLLSFFLFFLF